MNQCASCQKKGPSAKCVTCHALYPAAAPHEIVQCLDCGDGEMVELASGWLVCPLCKAQTSRERYGQRSEREKENITRGMVMAMLAEDAKQGEKGGGGGGDSDAKDARGGKVDPDTKSPGEGFRIGGRMARRPDDIIWSKTRKIASKSEVIRIRDLDASSAEIDEAVLEHFDRKGDVA